MRDTKGEVETQKEVGDSKHTNEAWSKDVADVRQVAVRVVDDVLNRAAEQANPVIEKRSQSEQGSAAAMDFTRGAERTQEDDEDLDFAGAPMIQIDLVGSRTPSPEEEESVIQFPTYESKRKNREERAAEDAAQKSKQSPVEDTASLREYLVGYMQELIKKAVPLAEEKLANKMETMDIEAVGHSSRDKGRRIPWHIRFRTAFSSFLQAICVCGDRHDDPCS